MANVDFVELFLENKLQKITTNSPQKHNVIKANSIKTEVIKKSENQPKSENLPEIKLKKRNDKVEIIMVTCSCGRETHIALEYEKGKNEDTEIKLKNE